MIYFLGKHFKFVRRLYYKATKGSWKWGLYCFIEDGLPNYLEDVEAEIELKEFLEKIFNS